MNPSEKNREERWIRQAHHRRFSDVRVHREGKMGRVLRWLRGRGKVVYLKPALSRRHPLLVTLVVLTASGVLFLGVQRLFTRAEVADFFPATCLGTWENVQNAQGKPEILGVASTPTIFSENNSAIFTFGIGQIFCGGFVPQDYTVAGDVKSVGLTLVWHLGETSPTSSFPQGAQVSTSSTNSSTTSPTDSAPQSNSEQASSSQIDSIDSTSSFDASQDKSEQEGSPQENETSTTSFLHNFRGLIVGTAFADDVDNAAPVENSATSTEMTAPPIEQNETITSNETTTQAIIIVEPVEAPLTSPTSSTEPATNTLETNDTMPVVEVVPAPPAPDDNFLKISYSVDGVTWIEIAKVNENNWQNFTVTLPISSWDLLKKLQIQIESIPTTHNPTPKVYLDGMFAEVHYDLPPVFTDVIGGGSSGELAPATNGPVQIPEGTTVIILPPSQKPLPTNPDQNTFKANEAPQFNLDLNSLGAPSSTPTL